MATATPSRIQRLLEPGDHGPLPLLDATGLVDVAEAAGLTGRGGAGFPSAIKLRGVMNGGRRPASATSIRWTRSIVA